MTLERVPTKQLNDFHPQQNLQLDCLQFRPILRLMAYLWIKGQPFEELVVEGLRHLVDPDGKDQYLSIK